MRAKGCGMGKEMLEWRRYHCTGTVFDKCDEGTI
jgi:hypothetical protein